MRELGLSPSEIGNMPTSKIKQLLVIIDEVNNIQTKAMEAAQK